MTYIPHKHPRYHSLMTRDKLARGMEKEIVAKEGLIAHGRGEAFDYLLGEKTPEEALKAEKAAALKLLFAENSVISINGNVVVLCRKEMVELANLTGSRLEVNLFHRTGKRIKEITSMLEDAGASKVYGKNPDYRIPGLEHERGKCCREGIGISDVILVPLEDGDRAEALKNMGKFVICIDLNPLSRTSNSSDISITDELSRAAGNMINYLRQVKKEMKKVSISEPKETNKGGPKPGKQVQNHIRTHFRKTVEDFDNKTNLGEVISFISKRLKQLSANDK